jgi:hypothetical protein
MGKMMTNSFDFTKLRRLTIIYLVVQIFLTILLVFMAMNFQTKLAGHSPGFLNSVIITFVIQLGLFFPINKFANWEARREADGAAKGLTPEETKKIRTRRMIGDVAKTSLFGFFVVFFLRAPKNDFILSVIFFTFITTYLSYIQNFNFAAKREMKARQ